MNLPPMLKPADLPEDTFGQRLRKWRLTEGIDAGIIAESVNLHKETLMRWEREEEVPHARNIKKIEKYIEEYNLIRTG